MSEESSSTKTVAWLGLIISLCSAVASGFNWHESHGSLELNRQRDERELAEKEPAFDIEVSRGIVASVDKDNFSFVEYFVTVGITNRSSLSIYPESIQVLKPTNISFDTAPMDSRNFLTATFLSPRTALTNLGRILPRQSSVHTYKAAATGDWTPITDEIEMVITVRLSDKDDTLKSYTVKRHVISK